MAIDNKDMNALYLAGEYDVLQNVKKALDLMDDLNPGRAYNYMTRAAYYLVMMATLRTMFDAMKGEEDAQAGRKDEQ